MSRYSLVLNNKVLDYKFKRRIHDYAFYTGHILIGFVSKSRTGWTAVSYYLPFKFPVAGFKTRLDACEFLITWNREELKALEKSDENN